MKNNKDIVYKVIDYNSVDNMDFKLTPVSGNEFVNRKDEIKQITEIVKKFK